MKITVAGGDLRMITVAEMFDAAGWECLRLGLGGQDIGISDVLNNSAAVILPLPCSKDGHLNAPMSNRKINIGDLFAAGGKNTLFIGGKMPICGENYIDYAARDEFQLRNAVPTAEGAVAIAMQELSITLSRANAVIIGYGRIGNYLAKILKDLNCNTAVIARKASARTLAQISGHKAFDFDFSEVYKNADVVFNTVPSIVLSEKELYALKKGAFVIDLASLPGGVDDKAAEKYGIKVIHALALPGKVAPVTAGEIIFDTVISILAKRGIFI